MANGYSTMLGVDHDNIILLPFHFQSSRCWVQIVVTMVCFAMLEIHNIVRYCIVLYTYHRTFQFVVISHKVARQRYDHRTRTNHHSACTTTLSWREQRRATLVSLFMRHPKENGLRPTNDSSAARRDLNISRRSTNSLSTNRWSYFKVSKHYKKKITKKSA